jgi:hypothetical protein
VPGQGGPPGRPVPPNPPLPPPPPSHPLPTSPFSNTKQPWPSFLSASHCPSYRAPATGGHRRTRTARVGISAEGKERPGGQGGSGWPPSAPPYHAPATGGQPHLSRWAQIKRRPCGPGAWSRPGRLWPATRTGTVQLVDTWRHAAHVHSRGLSARLAWLAGGPRAPAPVA